MVPGDLDDRLRKVELKQAELKGIRGIAIAILLVLVGELFGGAIWVHTMAQRISAIEGALKVMSKGNVDLEG